MCHPSADPQALNTRPHGNPMEQGKQGWAELHPRDSHAKEPIPSCFPSNNSADATESLNSSGWKGRLETIWSSPQIRLKSGLENGLKSQNCHLISVQFSRMVHNKTWPGWVDNKTRPSPSMVQEPPCLSRKDGFVAVGNSFLHPAISSPPPRSSTSQTDQSQGPVTLHP